MLRTSGLKADFKLGIDFHERIETEGRPIPDGMRTEGLLEDLSKSNLSPLLGYISSLILDSFTFLPNLSRIPPGSGRALPILNAEETGAPLCFLLSF